MKSFPRQTRDVLRLLLTHQLTSADLAKRIGISKRNTVRLLKILQGTGLEIDSTIVERNIPAYSITWTSVKRWLGPTE